MDILYCHAGVYSKNGWGRTFYMAKGMAKNGHNVTLLTINPKISFFKIRHLVQEGVNVYIFPDFFPKKVKSTGFAIYSTVIKIFFILFKKYNICISDCGHRFTSMPCKFHRFFHHSIYIAEWWDFFGKGGYLDKKSFLYKILFGYLESYLEISDKKHADYVVVLSSFMRSRAVNVGVAKEKLILVPGGAIVDDVPAYYPELKEKDKIVFGYIGINDGELGLLSPFLQAIKQFPNRFKFVVYGEKLSNDYLTNNGLSGIIEERGWINYSKDTSSLADIDIFVQLLDDNNISKAGWPNKLGDYLSFGKPVVFSPYGDLISFTQDQKGFFRISYSKESIISFFKSILDIPRVELYDMGKSNRLLAQTISWSERAKYIDIIKVD